MSTQTPQQPKKLGVRERLKKLVEEYGALAVIVFGVIWVLTLGSIWTAIRMGWKPESVAGQGATFGAAYVVFRFTLPLRIAATVVLTPVIARVLERLKLRVPKARPPA